MDALATPITESRGARICPSYIHATPGRLRVELADLRNHPAPLDRMHRRLAEACGVTDVRTNVILGSLTINFDPNFGLADVVAALRDCGVDLEAPLPRQAAPAAVPWKDLAIAGMTLHLLLDLLLYGLAASSLLRG